MEWDGSGWGQGGVEVETQLQRLDVINRSLATAEAARDPMLMAEQAQLLLDIQRGGGGAEAALVARLACAVSQLRPEDEENLTRLVVLALGEDRRIALLGAALGTCSQIGIFHFMRQIFHMLPLNNANGPDRCDTIQDLLSSLDPNEASCNQQFSNQQPVSR